MLLRALGAATAATLVVALAPTAAHAATPTYKVSISTSKASADVGQTVRVSGKVSGPRAAKKALLVQRRIGSGAWKTVSKVRTTTKRAYATNVKVATAGKQQLRVVAPKSKKVKKGVSTARNLTGWRWIDATTNAAIEGLTRQTATIQGRKYTGLAAAPDENGIMFVQVDGTCDALNYSVGVEGKVDSYAGLVLAQFADEALSTPLAYVEKALTGGTAPFSGSWPLRTDSGFIYVALSSNSVDTERAVLVAPRLHCSVNRLAKTVLPPG